MRDGRYLQGFALILSDVNIHTSRRAKLDLNTPLLSIKLQIEQGTD